jgi:undecaprenyl-diphosphatase
MSSSQPWQRFLSHRFFHLFRRLDFRLLVYLLSILLFIWCFWEIAELVREGVTNEIDERILLACRDNTPERNGIGPVWFAGAVRDITALGSVTVLLLLTISVTCCFLLQGRWQVALFLLTTVLLGWFAMDGLKPHYGRPRPRVVPQLFTKETSLSFPSGHARMSAVVYLTLGAILAQRSKKRSLKIFWIGQAVVLTLLVGASRVYLGVHNPSDVLAGWLVGSAWALFAFLLARLWRYRVLVQSWRQRHILPPAERGRG